MMVLGREEPLHWNKQLYAFDEITNECKLSKVEDEGLNRYSFVWVGNHDLRNERYQELIRELTAQRGEDPCWYLVWGVSEDPEDALSLKIKQQRSDEGWEVHHGDSFGVGQKMCELDSLAGFQPEDHQRHRKDGALFLIWGDVPACPDLVKPPTLITLKDVCERREMAPSSPFLSWVRERGLTFAYPLRDMQSHLAIVVLTPLKLDIGTMESKGLVSAIHEGKDATRAWCYMDENG